MLTGMLQFSLGDLLKDLFLTSIEQKKKDYLRNIIDIIIVVCMLVEYAQIEHNVIK